MPSVMVIYIIYIMIQTAAENAEKNAKACPVSKENASLALIRRMNIVRLMKRMMLKRICIRTF